METKYIYLIFSKTGTWLSNLISIITKSPYTHVALSFDDKFNSLYTFGRVNPNNPFSGGFTIESLNAGVYKKCLSSSCSIYKIPVTFEQLNRLKKELDKFVYSDMTFRYNFLGLIFLLLDKPFERKRHYFCSQFVTMLLEKSDIWHSSKAIGLTRPMDLMIIENKELIFKGFVNHIFINDETLTA